MDKLPGEWKRNANAQEKKGTQSNAINVLAVLEGDDLFTLALSAQGEEAPNHPGYRFPEPLMIQTYIKLETSRREEIQSD